SAGSGIRAGEGAPRTSAGNRAGGARLLRRGAGALTSYGDAWPYGIGGTGLVDWAHELADRVEAGRPVDAEAEAPRLLG
ncbi:hypothetical protein I3W98_12435, partial [Streptomyces cavourensis]|nr:hypothetical protein [Streptomyces cavourensis]